MAQLLSNLPIGAKVKFGKYQVSKESAQPIIWMVADKNHSGYPANSVTLITEKLIDILEFDAQEVEDDGSVRAASYDYKFSNINAWLNSSSAAGQWFSATHQGDTGPSYYGRPGFQYNFQQFERLAILPTTIPIQNIGNGSTSMVANVFIPTCTEILGTSPVSDSSSRLQCFSTISVQCTLTTQAFNNVVTIYKPSSAGQTWDYMTRHYSQGDLVSITAAGGRGESFAIMPLGIRPCTNLGANTKISSTTDVDGCYTILEQTIPTIDGSDVNLGEKTNAFSQTYKVNDTDNDPVTVTEYIDNVKIRSYVATLGATNAFTVSGATWLKLDNGTHTMKIVATDGFVEVTRTYTFVKNVTRLVVERTTAIPCDTRPKSIRVTVVKNIPPEADFKVEACNNGRATSPVWEDITDHVLYGRVYDFENTLGVDSEWGINIRVTVDRNGAEGACYITEIGGNFE